MDGANLLLAVLFGAIGMGYIMYGRREHRGIVFLAGIGLCAFPYFVSNVLLIVVIGAALMAVPFFIRD